MWKTLLATAFILCCLTAAWAVSAQDVMVDDFSKEVPGRWQPIQGEWKIRDGVMAHVEKKQPNHDRIIADFPFTEGMIEVKGVARKKNGDNWASLGVVIKHIDKKRNIWLRYGSYGRINIDGYGPPGFDGIHLGEATPELGREYQLTVIVRGGLIYFCIDDTMIGIIRDPWPGKAGKPGLFTEAGAEFDDFRVTRVSR